MAVGGLLALADAIEEIGGIGRLSCYGGKGVVPGGVIALCAVILTGEKVGAGESGERGLLVVLQQLSDAEVEERGFGAGELICEDFEALGGEGVVALGVGGEGRGELLGVGLGRGGFSAKDERGREVEWRGKPGNLYRRCCGLCGAFS